MPIIRPVASSLVGATHGFQHFPIQRFCFLPFFRREFDRYCLCLPRKSTVSFLQCEGESEIGCELQARQFGVCRMIAVKKRLPCGYRSVVALLRTLETLYGLLRLCDLARREVNGGNLLSQTAQR